MKRIYIKKFKKHAEDIFSVKESRASGSKLSAGYRLRWTEEGLLGEREAETAGNKVGRNISFRKINLLTLLIIAGFLLIYGKTAYLQFAHGSYYQELAENNRIRKEAIKSDRGVIYDRHGYVLTDNIPVFYLEIIPADLLAAIKEGYDINKITASVGDILGGEIEEELDYLLMQHKNINLRSYQPQAIVDQIDYQPALKLMIKLADIPGIKVAAKQQRRYLLPSLSFSHILGYTGIITENEYSNSGGEYFLTDYLGKTGIEKSWERELRGQYGEKQIEVDALGKEKRIVNEIKKQDGYNLLLAIDANLQNKLEEEIIAQMELAQAEKASGIILNPNNGRILAIVSLPGFNSNDFAKGISSELYKNLIADKNQPLFNRSISGEFATGSTFKMAVAGAALQEGIITKNTKYSSNGGVRIKEWFFPDWKAGGHGSTDVRKGIAESVNTFFYNISGGVPDYEGLGVKKITDYAKLFGFGEKLGIDLPGEAGGFLPSKEWKLEEKNEVWFPGDTLHLAIGQGDLNATPLQVAAYTAFFANRGILFQPQIVQALLNSDDSVAQKIEPKIIRHNFIDEQHVETIRQGLRDCVLYGSCRSLAGLPVKVAGKTGTAQWSSKNKDHSWFTGFAPYENPELVLTIIIEEGGESTDAAVPAAKRVLEWWFSQNEQSAVDKIQ